jgi:hypothetical protein
MTARQQRAARLVDLLIAHPDGLTIYELADELGISKTLAHQALATARAAFAELEDSVYIVVVVADRDTYRYVLVGAGAMVTDDEPAQKWVQGRVQDAETRIATAHGAIRTAVNATSGRTRVGKKARTIERALRHLAEDLAALHEDETA